MSSTIRIIVYEGAKMICWDGFGSGISVETEVVWGYVSGKVDTP